MPVPENYIRVPGSERAAMEGARATGSADPDERIQVTIILRHRRPLPVPAPRRHIQHDEFHAAFSAGDDDIEKVRQFAAANHLEVAETNADQRSVKLSGTVADFERAFVVELQQYEHPEGRYRGRVGHVHIPKTLDGIVEGVFGLDNRPAARPRCRVREAAATPAGSATAAASFNALQLARLYNFPSDVNGAGQSIGLLELGGGVETTDLAAYFQQLGLAQPGVAIVSVDGAKSAPNQDDGNLTLEVMLDIEVAGAVAPGSRIVVYFAQNTEQSYINAVSTAVHDTNNRLSVLSISWGQAEQSWSPSARQTIDQIFQAAGLLGITVCCASGDSGSSDGIVDGRAHADFPASSPNALGCGGTTITSDGATVASEVVWDNGPGNISGGGVSDVFQPVPAYQSAADIPPSANPGNAAGRGVPDVSGHAASYQIVFFGKPSFASGTSAVAPLWAGLVALLNQGLGEKIGFLNPLLYQHPEVFRDITAGTNGAYSAKPGWDACTGLGSPNGAALRSILSAAPASST